MSEALPPPRDWKRRVPQSVRRGRRALRRYARPIMRRPLVRKGVLVWRRTARSGRHRWRRSLQLRVVSTTVVLGLLVILGLGNFLLARIRDGLIESRRDVALAEAARLTRKAQESIDVGGARDDTSIRQQVIDVVTDAEGAQADRRYGVLLLRSPLNDTPSGVGGVTSVTLQGQTIPASLRREVNRTQSQQSQLTTMIPTPAAPQWNGVPAIAVGSIVDLSLAGPFEFYVVFPLDREQQILDLVRRTFVVGCLALIALIGAVAAVVTRQVVAPVRQAAITAEELASGRLDRRMKVRGDDDLARLARAFNGMAAGLELQIHQLEDLSRVQLRFVSDVSHELRTPLTTIRMASEVLYEERHTFDPVLERTAELLQTQLDRFEALLGDLLEISRFDAGAAALDTEPNDLRDVVVRVVDVLAPLADRRGCELRVEAPADGCIAEFDGRRVERILRNLVGNAIEHSEGIPIEIVVGCDDDAVAVAVRDHGVGLTEAEAQMVFNRFWRADPARARTTGGTGLGLAIALEDARLHDGWLEAWGSPGLGASFRLTLPRRTGVRLERSPLALVPGEPLQIESGPAEAVADRDPDVPVAPWQPGGLPPGFSTGSIPLVTDLPYSSGEPERPWDADPDAGWRDADWNAEAGGAGGAGRTPVRDGDGDGS